MRGIMGPLIELNSSEEILIRGDVGDVNKKKMIFFGKTLSFLRTTQQTCLKFY